jgi:cellulose 1,4-beta-cellobiosidase
MGAAAGSTAANLSWSASTDNVGVTGYIVRRNGVQVATPAATSYTDTGLSAGATYGYTVAARDAAGNISPDSASVSVTTAIAADTTPPSTPTGLTAAAAGSTGANLSWSASTDNVGVTGYIVRRNGVQVATPATTSYADTGLSVGTYSYTVAARDAAGNISPNSASASITIADTTPPTTPTGLTGAAAGSTGASLSWSASTDNVGVTGYIVRRNGVQIATPGTTGYADTGLSASTTYSYTVAARDAAGNISANSASVNVTTPPPPPSNSAGLAWDAVTGQNLSGYRVYFGTAPGTYLQPVGQGISVGNVTAYMITGLASGSRYYFAVTDFDTLGKESSYSNEVFKDIP